MSADNPTPDPETTEDPEEWAALTPQQRALLTVLPKYRTLTLAAGAIGVHRATAYRWMERSPLFRDDTALDDSDIPRVRDDGV